MQHEKSAAFAAKGNQLTVAAVPTLEQEAAAFEDPAGEILLELKAS